ncbi:putative nuclease of the RecB family [Nostoc sp. PCC 7524]|uniref:endonuclease NucS domain-containing protein n=1 Tax=Nostoc sp. (strain ATCC 29411 / PCC 7524) TaxID=28072 RepID=UPI00029EFC3F|nr:endonuclease NucS domain-containing protein [Nostoc sp. PCC 7524]AFY47471.1 putative nuclease of the RecB family [Nostoc sp. PCC 7524]
MQEDLKIWQVSAEDKLTEINKTKLNLEERIEKWLERDISILSPDLLVIGRQVITDYNGIIDLLCLDAGGNVVIVELKRDKTSREVTAQALDYASWVKNLSTEQVISIAVNYFNYIGKQETLEETFQLKFQRELPEAINSEHKIFIVASEIDSSTERIINYLSETYQVPINVAKFHYFNNNEHELLARKFLVDPNKFKENKISQSLRKANITYEELEKIAENNGVGNIYKLIYQGLIDYPFWTKTTRSCITFTGVNKNKKAIFNLIPIESNQELGLKFKIYLTRLSEYLNQPEEIITQFLPNIEPILQEEWSGLVVQGFFKSEELANYFLKKLNEYRSNTI